MRKDNAFLGLKSNPFLKHFNFTDWGDPFLILPSCEYNAVGAMKKWKKKKSTEWITIPVEQSILKKIKRCEQIIEKEVKLGGLASNSSVATIQPSV